MATATALMKTGLSSFGQSRLASVFKIKELRQKILITLLFLAIYRVGFHVPVPMVNQAEMLNAMRGSEEGLLGLISMFSGGSLSQSTIFGLGIMPYISASIIFQLLASVYPPLEKLQKEGEAGRKKINEYTRYATVVICLFQAWMWVSYIARSKSDGGLGLCIPGYDGFFFVFATIVTMTAGTVFLMWIGEQIDEYGIGNGISLLIMAGIVARIPDATMTLDLHARRLGFRQRRRSREDPRPHLPLHQRRHRRHRHDQGPAPNPDPVRQARARPARLRRHPQLPPLAH
jgi:preprotein translocase subunit SecY